MNLNEERTFQINNVVYVLGSPVIPVETLEQLAYSLSQQDVGNRPIVIINPQANTVPDFDKMLENYIENYTAGKQRPMVNTSYAFETASDEEIADLVSKQFQNINSPAAQQQIAIYQTIRRQSQVKHQIAKYQAEAEDLWRQHCINPDSAEGSERYGQLVGYLMPQAEYELQQISELLSRLNTGTHRSSSQQIVENPVENSSSQQTVENPVETASSPVPSSVSDFNSICLCSEWRDAAVKQMPRQAAEMMCQAAGYQKFQAQQSQKVPGRATVELWVLCQLGIPMYADGLPIVYTVDGRFQRVGESSRSILDSDYWFPRPIFDNYYDSVL